jgi:hypothetical protein
MPGNSAGKRVTAGTMLKAGDTVSTPSPVPPMPIDPILSLINSHPVTKATPLEKNAKVQIEWAGYWCPGEVVDVQGDDLVKVHYTGWESYWDEVVPRERLRLQAPGSMSITIHFDQGWAVRGTFVESNGDFVTLLREGDGKRIAVSKHRIAYLETND